MTVLGLVRAIGRVWFVIVVGVVGTWAAMFGVASSSGVYYGKVDVVFLRPVNVYVPNSLSANSESVIATAGIVQRQVMGGAEAAHVVSDGVTLAQEGITSGESVRVPNAGGQWANNFNRAELSVQVVDTTADRAAARMRDVLARIDMSLAQLQSAAGVQEDSLIRTKLNPDAPTLVHDPGNPRRALAMTLLLGTWTTGVAVVVVDRLLATRRRVRRSRATPVRTAVRAPAGSAL